jgi:hypothetical protein
MSTACQCRAYQLLCGPYLLSQARAGHSRAVGAEGVAVFNADPPPRRVPTLNPTCFRNPPVPGQVGCNWDSIKTTASCVFAAFCG